MGGPKYSPTGNCEIYDINVAIQVLKLCGDTINNRKVTIEVDQNNEQAYGNSGSYNDYGDDEAVFDKQNIEKSSSKGKSHDNYKAK